MRSPLTQLKLRVCKRLSSILWVPVVGDHKLSREYFCSCMPTNKKDQFKSKGRRRLDTTNALPRRVPSERRRSQRPAPSGHCYSNCSLLISYLYAKQLASIGLLLCIYSYDYVKMHLLKFWWFRSDFHIK